MIPLAIPNLGGNERAYLNQCIDEGFVSSVGEFVNRFERDVAALAGAQYGVATSSGTTALHLALVGVGVGRDDLVVLPTYTFIASANAISHCGATPWLFDVARDTLTLDIELLARTLERETEKRDGAVFHRGSGRRVAAIMPVFTMGLPPDMDRLVPLADHYGLPIVGDGAAALGALHRGRKIGACGARAVGISFNGNKTFTTGSGGAIVTGDAELAAKLKHLCETARQGDRYRHDVVGFNYRMSNVEAALGCAQLERANEFLAVKRKVAARYNAFAAADRRVEAFPEPDYAQHCWWFSGVILRPGVDPAVVLRTLRENGVGARPFWEPMHDQPPYVAAPRTPAPVADDIAPRVVILPSSTHITDAELDRVETALAAALDAAQPGGR